MAGDSGHISNSQTGVEKVGEAVMGCDHSLFYCFFQKEGGAELAKLVMRGFLNARVLDNQKQRFRSLTDLVWKACERLQHNVLHQWFLMPTTLKYNIKTAIYFFIYTEQIHLYCVRKQQYYKWQKNHPLYCYYTKVLFLKEYLLL